MPSLPSRRSLVTGVLAGVLSVATGWLEPLQRDDAPDAPQTLETSVVNEHALSHEVTVQVGSGESAVEASASVDGTTSRDLASVLPEVSEGGESDAETERYEVAVSVDGRRRVSTTVSRDVDSIRVRIDVIGTVEIERTRSAR
jgi:hypothetical protein